MNNRNNYQSSINEAGTWWVRKVSLISWLRRWGEILTDKFSWAKRWKSMKTMKHTNSTKRWRGNWWMLKWRRKGGELDTSFIWSIYFFSELLSSIMMYSIWFFSGYLLWYMFKILKRVVRAPLSYLADLRKLSFR